MGNGAHAEGSGVLQLRFQSLLGRAEVELEIPVSLLDPTWRQDEPPTFGPQR